MDHLQTTGVAQRIHEVVAIVFEQLSSGPEQGEILVEHRDVGAQIRVSLESRHLSRQLEEELTKLLEPVERIGIAARS